MHYEILDEKRKALLPLFSFLKQRFYLAGGTALALQIGHRDSVDFDFFCPEHIAPSVLFSECEKQFVGHALTKTQDETDTLGFLIDDTVAVSCMRFPYVLEKPLIESEYFSLASLEDIACMKFSALTSRSAAKDYVDMYFILKSFSLEPLLAHAQHKLPSLDTMLILKSLVYFQDVTDWGIRYMPDFTVSKEEIQHDLEKKVKEYLLRIKI